MSNYTLTHLINVTSTGADLAIRLGKSFTRPELFSKRQINALYNKCRGSLPETLNACGYAVQEAQAYEFQLLKAFVFPIAPKYSTIYVRVRFKKPLVRK